MILDKIKKKFDIKPTNWKNTECKEIVRYYNNYYQDYN